VTQVKWMARIASENREANLHRAELLLDDPKGVLYARTRLPSSRFAFLRSSDLGPENQEGRVGE
jgi:hypothetical protein